MDVITAAILAAVFASLAGLGGAWLGTQFSLRSLQRDGEAERRERVKEKEIHLRNIRLLLHVEIQQNLDTLKELQTALYAQREGAEVNFQAQVHFMATLLPTWGRLMFERLAHELPDALPPETIQRVYAFYWHLARLNSLQPVLLTKVPPRLVPDFLAWLEQSRAEQAQEHPTTIADWARYTDFKQFKADTQDIWNECLGIINGLVIGGNPVPEQ